MTDQPLRIAFFGTPEIALPTLERLRTGPHEACVVVSQPDRPRGRGRQSSPSPVARAAQAAGLPLLRPERVGAPECIGALKEHTPDLGVVVAFGQFLPRKVRELPSLGYLINAHASQLPRHRGAAPIAHAILAGDTKTAVSVMRVEREMDAGPVCLVCETPIADDDDVGSLSERLGEIAAEAIAAAVDQIAAGTVLWTAQDHVNATLAPKIGRHNARLDFRKEAVALARQIRATAPSPGAATLHDGEPLRILAARTSSAACDECPGTVDRDVSGVLRIATGSGWLLPTRVQRSGGKSLEIDAFLRGRAIENGTVLGDASASRDAG